MGFSRANARFFIDIANQVKLSGKALTLGVQDLSFSVEDIPIEFCESEVNVLTSETFLKAIGFDAVKSLDISNYEGADFIFDLNKEGVTEKISERFDVIFDTGTLEHVFHVPNALKNISEMLDDGGAVVHILPTANRLEHGFYMFCPTLFWDYYQLNEFTIEKSYIIRNYIESGHYVWEVFEFFPSNLDWLSMGKLNGESYSTIFVARKNSTSKSGLVPQQRRASKHWKAGNPNMTSTRPKSDVSALRKNVWIIGYNNFSDAIALMLTKNGFVVKGIVDSLKYRFKWSGGEVVEPDMWRAYIKADTDFSIICCARNLKGDTRNDSLFNSFFTEDEIQNYHVVLDSELNFHAQLRFDYSLLLEEESRRIVEQELDPVLGLPCVGRY